MTLNVLEQKQREFAKLTGTPKTKVMQVVTRSTQPTDSQMEAIRPFLRREFTADELYIRQMMLANDATDRSGERFDIGHLKRFSETIIGKSVQIGHEYSNAPVGKFFDSEVTKGANDWMWVAPWFYMPKSPGNQLERDNIDSGVWDYVSIGAYVDYAGLICDLCGQPYYYWLVDGWQDSADARCPHIIGQTYEGKACTCTFTAERSDMNKVEAVEGSIVYLGCQYDAAIAKSASQTSESHAFKATILDLPQEVTEKAPLGAANQSPEVNNMELEQLKADLAKATGERDESQKQVVDLQAQVATLTPLAEMGKQYAVDLKAEILRVATLIGEETTFKYVVETVDEVTKLKDILADVNKRWDVKCPPAGRAALGTGTEETATARVSEWSFSVI